VARLQARFGVERIAQVLTGSRSKQVIDRNLDKLPTFGRLQDMGIDEVKGLIGALVEAGLLERRGIEGGSPGAFVLALTEDGAEVMRGGRRPQLAMPEPEAPRPREGRDRGRRAAATRPSGRANSKRADTEGADTERADAGSFDAALLRRLKEWRSTEAKRRGVPAYVVFHDTTLTALAALNPRDASSLRSVKGLGPVKLEFYGEALLKLISGHAAPGDAAE
jgi:ATP-dependent DNA helicase RecQ